MEFNKIEPIYSQIINDIKIKLFNGTYKLGQEIPSRRELAKTLGVNPNTIQRAYREMEEMNLIVTSRGQGSFITSDEVILESLRKEAFNAAVSESIESLRSFGRSDEEILAIIKSIWRGESRND
ncbi:GntR family transcriptional regulator [Paenibacillus sp. N3.4]|uniref:GntR family transcriptional regulator n=1 Tax=Paenibacillus sp. N3.4 TaxID=2603222 RepID=UPI0011CB4500|nr:GntR family transcriptional regulator [Paenibacillus sp. N3.4]TXK86126.1 GntR family transcriptional regulator [Paenibacillus sp. N3.4]